MQFLHSKYLGLVCERGCYGRATLSEWCLLLIKIGDASNSRKINAINRRGQNLVGKNALSPSTLQHLEKFIFLENKNNSIRTPSTQIDTSTNVMDEMNIPPFLCVRVDTAPLIFHFLRRYSS